MREASLTTISPRDFLTEYVLPAVHHYGTHRLEKHLAVNAIIGRGDPYSAPRTAFDCTPPDDPTDPSPSADARFEDCLHA
jgi:hypothetical protein